MATTVDPLIEKLTDQNFADGNQSFRMQLLRSNAGDQAVAELTRNGFTNIALVGQAVIDDALLNGGLAKDILAQRSAQGQPQVEPLGGGTKAGGS